MNETILETIAAYERTYPGEDITPLQEFVATNVELISRRNMNGHVTGSVILINKAGEVLLIENPKFPEKLIFPGGHIDATDRTVENGALRELHEELGIENLSPVRVTAPGMPLDIDIHWIPANPRKYETEHQHYDFRFAYICDTFPEFATDKSEVQSMTFLPLDDLLQSPMHSRIAGKLKQAFVPSV